MYNHEELRSELFHIMHKLTEGKSSSQNIDANPQSPDGTKEKISKTQKQMVKFDIVHEYNRSMEHWYLKHNPSSTQVAMMCDFIADVMSWFSKKISRLTKIPPFMRENIDCVHLQKIGFGCKEHYEHMMRGVFEDRPWTCTSVGTRGRNKIEHDKDHETFYFLNRWIWIQFPWLALKTASKIYDQPHELPDNSSRPSSSHNNPRPVCFDGKKDRRFWNVKKKDTDSSIIIDSNNLSPRSKAMTHAGVAVPSAALLKVGKIKSKETRKKVPAIIPFSAKRKTRTRLEDKSSCFSAVGVVDETSPQDDDSGSPQISTKYSVFAQTQEDATLNLAFSRLSEMRDIYDNIVVERAGKAKYLKELEKSVAERSIGDEKGHKSIVAGEAILEKLQNRLDKINDLIGKASGVDNIYKEILIALQSCNPSDQKRHLELEQQIVLSKQQISDLNGREDILDREIDRALSASAEVSSAIKSTMLERQRLKPLLESLRIRTNEGIERRKALRVASYETMAFSRKNKLDSVLSVLSRRKTKRNDKLMRSQSLLAQPHAEDVIATITTLHPMEMLAHAAGTHDPFAIIEKMKQSESREDELRKRQDKNEILMKDRVLRLRSLQDKIQDLRLADGDSKTNQTTAAIDRQIANTESKLLSRQKELSSLTNLIQDIFLAVRNLHVMVQSIDHIQVCNAAISEVIQCTSDETNESRDDEGLSILPIKTLCDEILIGNNTPYSPCGMSRTGKLKSGGKEPYNLNNKKTTAQMDQKNTKKRCPNMRIFNKEEQESRYVEFTKQLHDLNDENICNNDCSTDANQDDDEDFGKSLALLRETSPRLLNHDFLTHNGNNFLLFNVQRNCPCM